VTSGRKSQQFLTAVTSEEKTDNEPHNTINRVRETTKRVHERRLFGSRCDVKILAKERRPPDRRL
jgi:hypothetical protein